MWPCWNFTRKKTTYICIPQIILPDNPNIPKNSTQSNVFTVSSCKIEITENKTAPPKQNISPTNWFWLSRSLLLFPIPVQTRHPTPIKQTETPKMWTNLKRTPKTKQLKARVTGIATQSKSWKKPLKIFRQNKIFLKIPEY